MTNDPTPDAEVAGLALSAVDHISAMVAYWDSSEICRFANAAYLAWFGKTREQLLGTKLRDLLGPLYEPNRPFIRAAQAGITQTFERQIPLPDGSGFRDSIATYTPDIRGGKVRGFFALVADCTTLKNHERELARVVAERDAALKAVRELKGLLPICATCKRIRDEEGDWIPMEKYLQDRTRAEFTHGCCPECMRLLYSEFM